MLTVSDLYENCDKIATELRLYLDSLGDGDRANLLALAEAQTPEQLEKLAAEAPDDSKRVFVENALVVRRVLDEVAAKKSEPLPPPWELPVIGFSTHPGYAALANMQKGAPLKLTTVSGWCTMGRKPSETVYVEADVVADLVKLGAIVPAVGQPWDERCKEYLLSAVGWRGMGCLWVDETAKIELRVYEIAGTERDTDVARHTRTIMADWRARVARRDTTPGWNRFSEFTVTLTDKVTDDGAKTVVCVFESGKQGHLLELHGSCLNAAGYVSHPIGLGYVSNKTVSQYAYEVACQCARNYVEEKKAAKRTSNTNGAPKKPAKPPIVIVADDEDADELAKALGIL